MKIMPWLDVLDGVEATDFLSRRGAITALFEQAAQSAALPAHLLVAAYVLADQLESDARHHWSMRDIEQAQCRVSDRRRADGSAASNYRH